MTLTKILNIYSHWSRLGGMLSRTREVSDRVRGATGVIHRYSRQIIDEYVELSSIS